MQGINHKRSNTPCQDFSFSTTAFDKLFISLSDGAGSSYKSDLGAENSAKAAVNFVCSNIDRLKNFDDNFIKRMIVENLQQSLSVFAENNSLSIKDLATTLISIYADSSEIIAFHIGDGILAEFDVNGIEIISEPSNGEFKNQTYFITDVDAILNSRVIRKQRIKSNGYIMLTDGAMDMLYIKSTNEFSKDMYDFVKWLREMPFDIATELIINMLNDNILPYSSDDFSIVIAIPKI